MFRYERYATGAGIPQEWRSIGEAVCHGLIEATLYMEGDSKGYIQDERYAAGTGMHRSGFLKVQRYATNASAVGEVSSYKCKGMMFLEQAILLLIISQTIY